MCGEELSYFYRGYQTFLRSSDKRYCKPEFENTQTIWKPEPRALISCALVLQHLLDTYSQGWKERRAGIRTACRQDVIQQGLFLCLAVPKGHASDSVHQPEMRGSKAHTAGYNVGLEVPEVISPWGFQINVFSMAK